jgi:hypothetical protein
MVRTARGYQALAGGLLSTNPAQDRVFFLPQRSGAASCHTLGDSPCHCWIDDLLRTLAARLAENGPDAESAASDQRVHWERLLRQPRARRLIRKSLVTEPPGSGAVSDGDVARI